VNDHLEPQRLGRPIPELVSPRPPVLIGVFGVRLHHPRRGLRAGIWPRRNAPPAMLPKRSQWTKGLDGKIWWLRGWQAAGTAAGCSKTRLCLGRWHWLLLSAGA